MKLLNIITIKDTEYHLNLEDVSICDIEELKNNEEDISNMNIKDSDLKSLNVNNIKMSPIIKVKYDKNKLNIDKNSISSLIKDNYFKISNIDSIIKDIEKVNFQILKYYNLIEQINSSNSIDIISCKLDALSIDNFYNYLDALIPRISILSDLFIYLKNEPILCKKHQGMFKQYKDCILFISLSNNILIYDLNYVLLSNIYINDYTFENPNKLDVVFKCKINKNGFLNFKSKCDEYLMFNTEEDLDTIKNKFIGN